MKSLLQTSIEEFVSLFDPNNHHRLPLFRMALTFDDEKMEIYPTLQDLEAAIFEILNSITNTMQVCVCVCVCVCVQHPLYMLSFHVESSLS